MEAKHSKGPWDYHSVLLKVNGVDKAFQAVISPKEPHPWDAVAFVQVENDESAANTALIVSAPEMRAALVAILESAGYESGKNSSGHKQMMVSIRSLDMARKALGL